MSVTVLTQIQLPEHESNGEQRRIADHPPRRGGDESSWRESNRVRRSTGFATASKPRASDLRSAEVKDRGGAQLVQKP